MRRESFGGRRAFGLRACVSTTRVDEIITWLTGYTGDELQVIETHLLIDELAKGKKLARSFDREGPRHPPTRSVKRP